MKMGLMMLVLLAVAGCTNVVRDDSTVQRVGDLERRMAALEAQQKAK